MNGIGGIIMKNRIFGYILAIVTSCLTIGGAFAATSSKEDMGKGYIAVIIDDFGYNGDGTEEMLSVDMPLTAAIMPFSELTAENVKMVKEAGKEAIIHMPMESKTGKKSWVGKKGIFMDMSDDEIREAVNDAFEAVDTAVGLNNHMGSAIMEDEGKINIVMEEAAKRDMIFVDSLTTGESKGKTAAEKNNVDYLERTVFIDSPDNVEMVINQLKKAALAAEKNGYAIAIGHVGPAGGKTTAEALKRAKTELENEGITFVTVSELNEIVNGNEKDY